MKFDMVINIYMAVIKRVTRVNQLFLYIFIVFFFASCSSDDFLDTENQREEQSNSEAVMQAKKVLPRYYEFIEDLLSKGYKFHNFNYLVEKKFKVENKTIILRHDVHYRDIYKARHMMVIDKELLGEFSATYFVQYNDPNEMNNSSYQTEYLNFIENCYSLGFDVQPHISLNDLIKKSDINDFWSNRYTKTELKLLFEENYLIENNGTDNQDIRIVKSDVFRIESMYGQMKEMLNDYNSIWEQNTGLKVQGYASHGSRIPMNSVINNAVLLDLIELESSGTYKYGAYNTKIFKELEYYSDNSLPEWMYKANLVNHDKIEMLAHPYLWD